MMLMRQRIQLSNAIRAHMAEFGLVAPIGREGLRRLIDDRPRRADERVPAEARACSELLADQLRAGERARSWRPTGGSLPARRATEVGRRLMEIPGVGPLLASALVASVADPKAFKTRPQPGGLDRAGAEAELQRRQGAARRDHQAGQPLSAPDAGRRRAGRHPLRRAARNARPWLVQLLARRATKVAAVALANKTARMVWAIMTSGERYREPVVAGRVIDQARARATKLGKGDRT